MNTKVIMTLLNLWIIFVCTRVIFQFGPPMHRLTEIGLAALLIIYIIEDIAERWMK